MKERKINMYKEKDSFITETVFFIWCKNLL